MLYGNLIHTPSREQWYRQRKWNPQSVSPHALAELDAGFGRLVIGDLTTDWKAALTGGNEGAIAHLAKIADNIQTKVDEDTADFPEIRIRGFLPPLISFERFGNWALKRMTKPHVVQFHLQSLASFWHPFFSSPVLGYLAQGKDTNSLVESKSRSTWMAQCRQHQTALGSIQKWFLAAIVQYEQSQSQQESHGWERILPTLVALLVTMEGVFPGFLASLHLPQSSIVIQTLLSHFAKK
jgi:hypothetical protein